MSRKLTSEEKKDGVFTPIRYGEQASKKERLQSVWSEFKWLIIFCAALVVAIGWMFFSVFSQIPDMTLYVVSSERVMSQAELDELFNPLYQYMVNVNWDGKAVIKIEAAYCDLDGSKADDPEYAQAIANFNKFAEGEKYIVLCDAATAEYIDARGWDRPMSNYSSKFGDEMVGMPISDIYAFENDTALYDAYAGWKLIMRDYEGSDTRPVERLAAYLYMEEAMADIQVDKYDYLIDSEAADSQAPPVQ